MAVVAPEQMLWCCGLVSGLSPFSMCIPLWLSWVLVCDQLQTSGHGASSSVPSCHQCSHPRLACRQRPLTGLCGTGESHI